MIFERTYDWALVKSIATFPKVWAGITDDFSPSAEDWEPEQDDRVWYVLAKSGADSILGMFIFYPENPICWRSHSCLLPESWGEHALTAYREACAWLWENSSCLRIIGAVPETNPLALRIALRCGLEKWGVNPKAFQKDGKLVDVIMVGISKPETA